MRGAAAALLIAALAACGDDAESRREISCDQVAEHVVDTFAEQMIDDSREASLTRVQATCASGRMPQLVRQCVVDAQTMDAFVACTEAWAQPLMKERRQKEIEELERVRERALQQKRELEALDERLQRLEEELEATEGAIDEAVGGGGSRDDALSGGDAAGDPAP